jgi:hypothetical protein
VLGSRILEPSTEHGPEVFTHSRQIVPVGRDTLLLDGDSAGIRIKGTSCAAFNKALLRYLYTDSIIDEVDGAELFDLAKLSDQNQVQCLHNLCLHRFFKDIIV